MRGSNSDLTGKTSAFWIGNGLWKLVAYERWTHMEVWLDIIYLPLVQNAV